MAFRLPRAARVIENPSADEAKELTAEMANARSTRYGNLNVQTEVLARSKGSTFIVTDEPDGQNQAISRDEAERWAEVQDDYIAGQEMVQVDGFIGGAPDFRVPARLYIERRNANVAAMQQQLYFDRDEDVEPELTVVYTPNLPASGYPDDRLIAVDLELGVTRVFNSDYFGESKKGGLRMWNQLVYDRGGLALHAGAKVIPTAEGDRVAPLAPEVSIHLAADPLRDDEGAGAARLRQHDCELLAPVAGRHVDVAHALNQQPAQVP